ncbi:MAG: addiction module protein [Dehalococcoidia bacterium]
MGTPAVEFEHLTRDQRLDLIEELWESLSQGEREDLPLTDEQRAELDRRLDLLDRDGPVGVSLEELINKIKSKSA